MKTHSQIVIAPDGTVLAASSDCVSSNVTIEVSDDGPGSPADTVKRLFLRDGLNVRGPGLALLLIRDIVIAHGGAVDLQSSTDAVGHGTAIRLTFPARYALAGFTCADSRRSS